MKAFRNTFFTVYIYDKRLNYLGAVIVKGWGQFIGVSDQSEAMLKGWA